MFAFSWTAIEFFGLLLDCHGAGLLRFAELVISRYDASVSS